MFINADLSEDSLQKIYMFKTLIDQYRPYVLKPFKNKTKNVCFIIKLNESKCDGLNFSENWKQIYIDDLDPIINLKELILKIMLKRFLVQKNWKFF